MELEEYFVELFDRDILVNFPNFSRVKMEDQVSFSVSGSSKYNCCAETMPSTFRKLSDISEITFNILCNIKNENMANYHIEYIYDILDEKSHITFNFKYKFTSKNNKRRIMVDDTSGSIGIGSRTIGNDHWYGVLFNSEEYQIQQQYSTFANHVDSVEDETGCDDITF